MLLVPTRIDRYEIKGRLGAGGMGTLYLARDTNPTTDRLVVLKLLRTSFDSDELRRRFVREARALAELNHPNIVVIYDSGVFDDSPFIVMEYVRGETLAESIRRQAPIPLAEKLRLLSELCSGLAHAHAAGIIHRDIKPANLVVDLHGRLKILDFGIARVDTDATLHVGPVTQVAMQMGTPGYMSPEQIESGEVDARSDLFAAGAVAYELFSGREAFRGANTRQIERQVLGEQPAPLASLVPGLDPAIAEIVAGALEKDVRRRCQSAAELADAFDRVRSRLPGESRLPRQTPPPPRPSGERKSRRERTADAAYERAANSYREGAEECARRFAMEAIAEAPLHAEARRLLLDLGRFRDVEPWLPPEAKAPVLPEPGDSSVTVIAPLPPPEPPSPPRPSTPPAVPASPTSSSGAIVATPGLGVTPSGTFVVTPGDDYRPPVAGTGATGDETVVAQLPPKPSAPPRLSQPPKPPRGRTRPGVWRLAADRLAELSAAFRRAPKSPPPPKLSQPSTPPQAQTRPGVWRLAAGRLAGLSAAFRRVPKPPPPPKLSQPSKPPRERTLTALQGRVAGRLAGLPPAARWAVMVGAVLVIVAGAASAVWLLFLSGPGLETLTITPPKNGTIEGGGIRCGTGGSQCTAELPRGSTAVLTAVPDPEFAFAGFSGDCMTDGVTKMDGPRRCGASFDRKPPQTDLGAFTLTIEKPDGGTVVGDGIRCGTQGLQCEATPPSGATVQLQTVADARFKFVGFTGDCDAKGGTTKMDGPRTCGATFAKVEATAPGKPDPEPSWTLTISKPTGGTIVGDRINCGADGDLCGASFKNNVKISLSPKAESGWKFVEFTGDCRPAGEVVMAANRTCGATFVKEVVAPPKADPVILVVTRPQNGTILGNGINCGPKNEECSSPQPAGASVRLTAWPNAGFVFAGFIGHCDANGVVDMTSSRTCGARFVPTGSSLPAAEFPMLSVERPRNATVYGPGIECGSGGSRQCKAQQPVGSTAQLRVQPDSGYVFLRFGGDCEPGGRTVMTGPRKCTVLVQRTSDRPPSEQAYPTLTVIKPTGGTLLGNGINCGTGGSACSARQPAARPAQLTARPDTNFEFIRFTGDCDASGTTIMDGPRSCGAVFNPKGGQ